MFLFSEAYGAKTAKGERQNHQQKHVIISKYFTWCSVCSVPWLLNFRHINNLRPTRQHLIPSRKIVVTSCVVAFSPL